ncbi:MAG: spermidine/putrescine ABC transporter substrate-binding protein [Ruminococcaceae bacterium]|nr:spermidine/putrescine ABC transporter substrate-binding protein [Oscillospiraceae bacterium]
MKRFLAISFVLAILLSTLAPTCFAIEPEKDYSHLRGTSINVYNWGEYISDGSEGTLDVNKEFTKRYGIKVNYTTFESNENMYNKLQSGGANYDIVIPSDYMIAKLMEENMLVELDFSNIPNYKYILPQYKNLFYDPQNKYTVPYTVGMVGLIYNTTMVDDEVDSWSILWNEKYKGEILMFNNPRDAFGIAQFLLGQSVNTHDTKDWDKAIELLKEQRPLVSSYVMDEVYNKMEGGEAAFAPYYAGDYLTMADVNPDLAFVYPKEGVNYFVDAMCIPKTAENKEAAELYINFMLEEDIAVANANYICYASPHELVLESDDYDLKGEPVLYPDESETPKTESFQNLSYDIQNYMSQLWSELKVEGNTNIDAYIGLSVTLVLVIVFAIFKFVQKKKREKYYD